jgi:hypothetical protein
VLTPGRTTTSSTSFAVTPPPTISGFSPTSGHAGQQVTIIGSNFANVIAVKLGTTPAKFTLNSPTKLTAVVPKVSRGYYVWTITTSAGTTTSTSSDHLS